LFEDFIKSINNQAKIDFNRLSKIKNLLAHLLNLKTLLKSNAQLLLTENKRKNRKSQNKGE
jgi:hypothetical protein